jgi:mannonate dehydratase
MVTPALILPPTRDERWDLAAQTGVESAVIHTLEIGDGTRLYRREDLERIQSGLAEVGIDVSVIEGGVPVTDTTRLGKPGRDEEIDRFKTLLRNCGDLGIEAVCYDWMAGRRWARTDVAVPARGGSLTTEYRDGDLEEHHEADFTRDDLWESLAYFLEEVVPVAEEADVRLGLHPDDPPIPSVGGYPRIVTSPDAYREVFDLYDSPHNGVTLCQGNFAAMGADVPDVIREFGERDRIAFVHFRDVEGAPDSFVETWHDEGPTDLAACIDAYRDVGFDGPARPDHVPTMAGEDNSNPGYHPKGRLFAVGYMRGLLHGVDHGRSE